jgi:hypothetical protein
MVQQGSFMRRTGKNLGGRWARCAARGPALLAAAAVAALFCLLGVSVNAEVSNASESPDLAASQKPADPPKKDPKGKGKQESGRPSQDDIEAALKALAPMNPAQQNTFRALSFLVNRAEDQAKLPTWRRYPTLAPLGTTKPAAFTHVEVLRLCALMRAGWPYDPSMTAEVTAYLDSPVPEKSWPEILADFFALDAACDYVPAPLPSKGAPKKPAAQPPKIARNLVDARVDKLIAAMGKAVPPQRFLNKDEGDGSEWHQLVCRSLIVNRFKKQPTAKAPDVTGLMRVATGETERAKQQKNFPRVVPPKDDKNDTPAKTREECEALQAFRVDFLNYSALQLALADPVAIAKAGGQAPLQAAADKAAAKLPKPDSTLIKRMLDLTGGIAFLQFLPPSKNTGMYADLNAAPAEHTYALGFADGYPERLADGGFGEELGWQWRRMATNTTYAWLGIGSAGSGTTSDMYDMSKVVLAPMVSAAICVMAATGGVTGAPKRLMAFDPAQLDKQLSALVTLDNAKIPLEISTLVSTVLDRSVEYYRANARPDGTFGDTRGFGGAVGEHALILMAVLSAGAKRDDPMPKAAMKWLEDTVLAGHKTASRMGTYEAGVTLMAYQLFYRKEQDDAGVFKARSQKEFQTATQKVWDVLTPASRAVIQGIAEGIVAAHHKYGWGYSTEVKVDENAQRTGRSREAEKPKAPAKEPPKKPGKEKPPGKDPPKEPPKDPDDEDAPDPMALTRADNSNSQYAVLGLKAASLLGGDFSRQVLADEAKRLVMDYVAQSNAAEVEIDLENVLGDDAPDAKADGKPADKGKSRTRAPRNVKVKPGGWEYMHRGMTAGTPKTPPRDPAAAFKNLPAGSPYLAMTAAGVSSLVICREEMALAGLLDEQTDTNVLTALGGAHAAMATLWRIYGSANLGEVYACVSGGWGILYSMYATERACVMAGWEKVGEHFWYEEGAKVLASAQEADGRWRSDADWTEDCDNTFAILFLKRMAMPVRRGVEITGRKPPEKKADKPSDKPADPPPGDKPAEPPPGEKPADKPAEPPPAEKPTDKPADPPSGDKPTEKPTDPPAPADKPEEKPADKPAEKPADKPAEKPADKPADEPQDPPAEKPAS